ncbi:MAG TPA: DUF1800 domain-containing protein [Blastocatellia bacterium]|nr:DUF1800 domain-containing protein [Blastocatellia bacterium]
MASFGYDDAAHLLRRMGFGGPPSQIKALQRRGLNGAVNRLLNYQRIGNGSLNAVLSSSFNFSDPNIFANFNIDEIRRWWFTRMVHTARPFEEKMTLFWHNHFATADSKLDNPLLMYLQNLTLRKNALGRFDDLFLAIAQDPAMLIYLDGVKNHLGDPNENFARECQELFSMGIFDVITGEPNYTQDDIHQIARTFTGWGFFWPNYNRRPFNVVFGIDPNDHDSGSKTIYGVTANYEGQDILQIIGARRATARFLVKKLWEFFVYPLNLADAADQQTVEKYADVYMTSNHSIVQIMQAIFTSDEFFSDRARFALVKSPVEFVVSSVQMAGATHNPGTSFYDPGADTLQTNCSLMGQELLNPPDVSGWTHGVGWINTATALNRYTYGNSIVSNRDPNSPGVYIAAQTLSALTRQTATDTVNSFLTAFGPLALDSAALNNLANYLTLGDDGSTVPFTKNSGTVDKKIRGLVHQIMCLPEYQLN